MLPVTLSCYEVASLLAAWREGKPRATSSLDLRQSTCEVVLSEEGARFPRGPALSWALLRSIAESPTQCFSLDEEGAAHPIKIFSEETGWVRTLFPTEGWPTTIVAGFTMHRIQGIDPAEDTRRKLRPLFPCKGPALDTATGLGYTAIGLARELGSVVTVERDPAAIEIARQNPWSQALFTDAVTLRVGDILEVLDTLAPGSFGAVLHDPPTMRLAGELYSLDCYRKLHRVLRPGGKLSHYIGNPESKGVQAQTRGVIQRLQEAGFSRVTPRPEAFGVLAVK